MRRRRGGDAAGEAAAGDIDAAILTISDVEIEDNISGRLAEANALERLRPSPTASEYPSEEGEFAPSRITVLVATHNAALVERHPAGTLVLEHGRLRDG